MKFRTQLDIAKSAQPLCYSSRILALGSCFAHSIGGKLRDSKFDIEINPLGVLFNPLSIVSAIERFEERRGVQVGDLQHGRQGWFHFDFHSSLSDIKADVAAAKMNDAVDKGHRSLRHCDTVIITLGSVWVYRLVESGEVVANCHKEPSRVFERSAMSVSEVVDAVGSQVAKYPDKRFIFSVSPVRHLADGAVENSLSKATLRVALAEIESKYSNASYFPAYEILMDDLRDYRFYADDMLHPSTQAIEYIWSKFCDSQISDTSLQQLQKVTDIMRAAAHRPFNECSEQHQEFCRRQLSRINELPNIDFGKESAYFRSQLQNNL